MCADPPEPSEVVVERTSSGKWAVRIRTSTSITTLATFATKYHALSHADSVRAQRT